MVEPCLTIEKYGLTLKNWWGYHGTEQQPVLYVVSSAFPTGCKESASKYEVQEVYYMVT